jgi:choice-of-anchor A domain-containing protein
MFRVGATALSQARLPAILGLASAVALGIPEARAGFIGSVPNAANYGILYSGGGGHSLTLTNTSEYGNIGVGNTGHVNLNGGDTIQGTPGRLDFSASNTSQYSHSGTNTGPASVNYNVAAVTTALSQLSTLSSSLGSEAATSIAINGTQTINAATGKLDANGNYVFNVTSYNEGIANTLTIQNAGGHSVVFNFEYGANVSLAGNVTLLGGLTDDQVLWNFASANKETVTLNNTSGSPNNVFHGDILALNDAISITSANLDGRIWGGDSSDLTIVSSKIVDPVPEPASLVLFGSALAALGAVRRRKFRQAS